MRACPIRTLHCAEYVKLNILVVCQLHEFVIESDARQVRGQFNRIWLPQSARNRKDSVRAAVPGELLQMQARHNEGIEIELRYIQFSRNCLVSGKSDSDLALKLSVRQIRRQHTHRRALRPSDVTCPLKFPSTSFPSFRFTRCRSACATGARSGPLPRSVNSSWPPIASDPLCSWGIVSSRMPVPFMSNAVSCVFGW